MDRPPSQLFRQAAIEAAAGTQVRASLATYWRGVPVFAGVAVALLAALVAFVAIVEHAPVHRIAARVEANPVFTTAPSKDALVVKLLVAPAALASVRPGAKVRLAFRAYPQERFGLFAARIDSLDEIASPAGEVGHAAGAAEPTLVAIAALPAALRGPHGETLPLEPGMVVEALVAMEPRTLLRWLLDAVQRGVDDDIGRPSVDRDTRR